MTTKILAIDDDQNNLTAISMLLEKTVQNCAVFTAQSGVEGIKKAREASPDTVILDLQMPDLNGFDVCRKLKSETDTKHIPIIMLTGVGIGLENRVKGLNSGADAYLTKPVEPDELTAQVKAVLRIKETEERLRKEKKHQEDLVQKKTQALSERERAFFTLTDNLPGMVFRCRNDKDYTMEFVSRGCLELTGYGVDDIVKNKRVSYGALIHKEDREKVWNEVQNALGRKRSFTATYRITTAEGFEKWLWQQGCGVYGPDGDLLAIEGFTIDITERKQLEDRLVSREHRLTQTIQGSPIPTFMIDKDHIITHWNKGCEELTGCSAVDMVGKNIQWKPFYGSKRPVLADLIVDGDLGRVNDLYKDKRAKKSRIVRGAWEVTDFFKDLGGSPRHVFFMAAPICDCDGNIIGAIETLQDITKQKEFEYELMQSEQRYRVLTEQVADGVVVMQNDKFAFVNDSLVSMIGCKSPQEVLGRQVADFVSADFLHLIRKLTEEVEANTVDSEVTRMKCHRVDGSEFWIEAHNRLIDWKGKGAVLATVRDITALKLQEEAQKKESNNLRDENTRLKSSIRERYRFGNIIGKSSAMQQVYEQILEAATVRAPVIIYGESGTGKELAARAIHDLSERHDAEFVTVNCGAIPENLLESEFFGHKKGAFTGAHCDKHGYLDSAHNGFLFLDELGELGLNLQVKLLRAIEGGGYAPVGGGTTRTSDFRIIAATNRDLKEAVKAGLIREDFFYRIHVIPITLPPLRDRKEDIPLLIDHFVAMYDGDRSHATIPVNVLESLRNYHWPGNVRELQNIVNRYLTTGKFDFFQVNVKKENFPNADTDPHLHEDTQELRNAVESFEKAHIIKALTQTQWNRTKAASLLGVSRKTLFRKMKGLGLTMS